MNPITKLVQLVLDKAAAAKLQKDAEKAAKDVDQSMSKVAAAGAAIGSVFAAVGAAIVAALSIHKILEFGRVAVEEATKAEKVWNNLAGTVRAAGESWEDMEAQVRSAGAAFQDATTHTDEDYAQSLTRLITLTGDVSASTTNMGLVANVAAQFFNDDLAPAADLVAKVMNGNLMMLQRMGIHVKSAQEGLEVLAQRSFGAATRQTETFSGRLARLNNLWGEFKEQLGDVLITADNTDDVLETLRGVVRDLIQWVGKNKVELKALATEGLDLVMKSALVTADALALVGGAIGEILLGLGTATGNEGFVRMGARIAEFNGRIHHQVAALQDLWTTIGKGQRPVDSLARALTGSTPLSRYIAQNTGPVAAGAPPRVGRNMRESPESKQAREAAEEMAFESGRAFRERARDATRAADALHEPTNNLIADLEQQAHMFGMTADQLTLYKAALAGAGPEELAIIERLLARNRAMAEGEDARQKMVAGMKETGEAAKEQLRGLQEELSLTASIAPMVGEALGAALTGGLGPYFSGKATQNLLEAAELGVQAFTSALNPFTAWRSGPLAAAALKHLALAAAFKAASSAFGGNHRAGASVGGIGASAGGSSSAASGVSSRAAAGSTAPAPQITIVLDGPGFDALQPEVQRVVIGAQQEARARYGNNVVLRTRRSFLNDSSTRPG